MNNNFIKNIQIKNYKCFSDFQANELKRVNLIAGKNNIGKTAFMEACYLGMATKDKDSFFHSLLVLELCRNPLEEFKIIEDSNNFDFKFSNCEIKINDEVRTITDFQETLYDIPSKDYQNGIKVITNFYNGKNKPLNIKNKKFIALNNIRDDFMVECIDEIKLKDMEDNLNSILKELFDIKKIDVIKNQVMIKQDKEFIKLNEFGDGVKHFLNIILALYLNENSTIYLDEIENGIHYLLFDKLWDIILKLSKEQNVQVFATTHSKECIDAYYKSIQKKDEIDITFIELGKNKENIIKANVMNIEKFSRNIEIGNGIRGW